MKFIIVALLIALIVAEYERFDNHKVIRFNLTTNEQVDILRNLEELQRIDLWSETIAIGEVEVRIPREYQEEVDRKLLKKFNIRYSTKIENLQALIDQELASLKSRVVFDPKNSTTQDQFFQNFRRIEEIYDWLKKLEQQSNGIAKVVSVGKTHEGRDILGLKIEGTAPANRPAILYHGGIHAREWISPSTVCWIINELVTKYNSDQVIKRLVDSIQWHIFPVLNVDGYHFTWTSNRMWRKTRRPNQGSTCIGTDPNRNFPYRWNTGGSSGAPCSETYHGPNAGSEIEVRGIMEYGKKLLPRLKGYIDFHAYGMLYMRPWGWTRNESPDEARLKRIGDGANEKIRGFRGSNYRSGRIAVIIYVASGSSADYFYGEHKVNAYALELGTSFTMPPSEIRPVGQENFEGVKFFAEQMIQQWNEEQGISK